MPTRAFWWPEYLPLPTEREVVVAGGVIIRLTLQDEIDLYLAEQRGWPPGVADALRAAAEEATMSPAKTERQRRFIAAEHERVKEGKEPRATKGMTQKQREDFMKKGKGRK